jgi:flagellum-specific ATP synthase
VQLARRLRESLALLQSTEDLIRIGAYVSGSNDKVDASIRIQDDINAFLCQLPGERSSMDDTVGRMNALAQHLAGDATK